MDGTFDLTPARQVNLREIVYLQLKEAFMIGAFAPGDALNLRDLANRFETSMTPVREAVRRLVAEGALVDAPGRTLRVPALDRSRLIDLKRARIALETMVTELAVERATPADVAMLESVLLSADPQSARENGSQGGLSSAHEELKCNRQFHFALYRISDSPTLMTFIESLWLQYGPFLNLLHTTIDRNIDGSHRDHYRIVEAARCKDADAAKQALTTDISRSFEILDAYILSGAK